VDIRQSVAQKETKKERKRKNDTKNGTKWWVGLRGLRRHHLVRSASLIHFCRDQKFSLWKSNLVELFVDNGLNCQQVFT
jgi:hypothetical protein